VRTPRIHALPGVLGDIVFGEPSRIDVLVLAVGPGEQTGRPSAAHTRLAARLGIDLAQVIQREDVRGTEAEVVRVPWSAPVDGPDVGRVVLVGVGSGQPSAFRSAGAAVARAHRGHRRLVTSMGPLGGAAARAFAEGLVLGSYAPPRSGLSDGPKPPVARVDVVGRVAEADLASGVHSAEATVLARDLTQTPSSTKSPAWMAARARRVAVSRGLRVRVRGGRELRQEGFGGLVAVGSAAARGPRLVELEYCPPDQTSTTQHVVLVGKGVTFDTGGLCLKPRDSMVAMKTDMAGAGVVLAVLGACTQLGVRVRVTGLLALAENAIGAGSYRPGDVVTPYGGRSVEVANTDAEGRLVLADALAYADAVLAPDLLVDVATLTGAAASGLGRGHAALYSTDDRLVAGLQRAAAASGEQVWRMPLAQEYRSALDSTVADIAQVTGDPRIKAGSILGALFLREFVGSRRWAHLDIAGPARSERDQGLLCRGGTGYGARLLLRWLEGLR
jgi:leucyl aminopeptidase